MTPRKENANGFPLEDEVPRPHLGTESRRSARTLVAVAVRRGLSSTDERVSCEGSCHRSHTGSLEVV